MITELHCIQIFQNDIWKTCYVSSFATDAADTYDELLTMVDSTLRLVTFGVQGVDFIATQARDFKVLGLREAWLAVS
jgi:hypothetical protein